MGGNRMKNETNVRLTSAELSNLWASYMNDSMAICVIKHFLKKAEDKDVQSVLKYSLELAQKHVNEIPEIFKKENQPIPQGFTDNDVDVDSPRLYSDTFALIYLQNMTRLGLIAYGVALPLAAREDVNDYYHKCVASSAELSKKVTKVMLKKGVYSRPPYIPISEQVEFIEKQGYMSGYFGKRRPLAGVEATNIYICLLTNIFGKVLLTGYGQVAKSKEVRNYMMKGAKIGSKHIEVLSGILTEDNLSAPPTWDSEVTTSTVAPFSDKLMMFHTRALSMASIANYGAGSSTVMRHDLIPQFARLATEMGKFGDDGAEIMIKHKWLEKPPQQVDREKISTKGGNS
jgi:hypothetical protein